MLNPFVFVIRFEKYAYGDSCFAGIDIFHPLQKRDAIESWHDTKTGYEQSRRALEALVNSILIESSVNM